VICASYAQDLADKLAGDCRSLMLSKAYQELFPATLAATRRQAVHDFATAKNGFRLATSVGGVLTGRGAQFIVIDDPLKPDEALSKAQRQAVNDWYEHTLVSRLNDKRDGCIILIMQRLHEDDLVGHVLQQGGWRILKFPAIAEENENHVVETPFGRRIFARQESEVLHSEREPIEVLAQMREVQGEYNFAGQYQQAPAPLGGGLVKAEWYKTYTQNDQPAKFEMIFQSWDTANKPTELSDYSVCSTWGVNANHLYLLHIYRKRVGYPELKRAVRDQAEAFCPQTILIEDKASGTQLIQELIDDQVHSIKRYVPTMDKIMRMHSITSTIENGFVYLPDKAAWLGEYLHELTMFPKAKNDDQADSTSQALDWFKSSVRGGYGLLDYAKQESDRRKAAQEASTVPKSKLCSRCNSVMSQPIPGGLRCAQCGEQWSPPTSKPRVLTRKDILNRSSFSRF
jgi:predicted phage terminase large subunit-like protein